MVEDMGFLKSFVSYCGILWKSWVLDGIWKGADCGAIRKYY